MHINTLKYREIDVWEERPITIQDKSKMEDA